jgi:hypothetical protein
VQHCAIVYPLWRERRSRWLIASQVIFMPPKKKTKLTAGHSADAAAEADPAVIDVILSTDVLAIILGCLGPVDIMRLRRVGKKWREAAKKTIVPLTRFRVDSVDKYRAMAAMTTALPNLQKISIRTLGRGHKYSDGEDPPEERAAETADDIDIISRFKKLRILEIEWAPLNGRYHALFNFPLLLNLRICYCPNLKWDLEMLSGLPSLRELDSRFNRFLSGNIKSLRALRETLETVSIIGGSNRVVGDFMDLADFTCLNTLDVRGTAVAGDIRDMGENDFPKLEYLYLPTTVFGGKGYQFQRISDVPSVMNVVYQCMRRNRTLFSDWCWYLSQESPDWYNGNEDYDRPDHPFAISFVHSGSRFGWRWRDEDGNSCEINWLDPEPERGSVGYETYTCELQNIQEQIDFYKGYYQPPTEEEYNRLCEEYNKD